MATPLPAEFSTSFGPSIATRLGDETRLCHSARIWTPAPPDGYTATKCHGEDFYMTYIEANHKGELLRGIIAVVRSAA